MNGLGNKQGRNPNDTAPPTSRWGELPLGGWGTVTAVWIGTGREWFLFGGGGGGGGGGVCVCVCVCVGGGVCVCDMVLVWCVCVL